MTVRTVGGVTLLVLVSLFSTVKLTKPADQFAYKLTGITEIVPDDITLYEQRFAGLRPLLSGHGTAGYITDGDPHSLAVNEKYLAVRYVLAPVLVENSPRHALVVGNIMLPTTDLARLLREENLALLRNLGDGVLLLQGADR